MRVLAWLLPPGLVLACRDVYEFQAGLFAPANFQLKLRAFLDEDGRPPFKEAWFLQRLNSTDFDTLSSECPGAFASAHLVALETVAFTEGVEAARVKHLDEAWKFVLSLDETGRQVAAATWPLERLFNRAQTSLAQHAQLQGERSRHVTVSFVVCHCREDLSWLQTNVLHIPAHSSLYVYEKCRQDASEQLASVAERFSNGIFVIDKPDGEVRGDECSGFLSYLTEFYDDISDYTILLQSDPDHHLFFSYLDVALRGISTGSFSQEFLHLNYHRHVVTSTPCMRDVEDFLFLKGKFEDRKIDAISDRLNQHQLTTSTELLSTYCCSEFVVHKSRIHQHPKIFYAHMLHMVDGTYPDLCVNGQPKRSSQCYVFEFLWHVVFGEPRVLPFRVDDQRLPPALRMKYGNEHVRDWWQDLDLAPGSRRPLAPTVRIQ